MRLVLFALVLTLPAASAALPARPPASPASADAPAPARAGGFAPSRICPDAMKPRDARSPQAAKPRRLGELPPADLTLAVVNQVGDCMEPVIVRQGLGGPEGR